MMTASGGLGWLPTLQADHFRFEILFTAIVVVYVCVCVSNELKVCVHCFPDHMCLLHASVLHSGNFYATSNFSIVIK